MHKRPIRLFLVCKLLAEASYFSLKVFNSWSWLRLRLLEILRKTVKIHSFMTMLGDNVIQKDRLSTYSSIKLREGIFIACRFPQKMGVAQYSS
ncbi:hypothetical protein BDW69DRAFT_158602 [Aspergillus filifer]